MQGRRAVGLILGRLRERADENNAIEADALAKTTIVKTGRTAFRKSPDEPLGLVVQRKLERREELAHPDKRAGVPVRLNSHPEGVFDTPYVRALHKRDIMREVRIRVNAKRWGRDKKTPWRIKEAEKWRKAILRDAPLLKGFFAEEPQWRDRMLRWCQETLGSS